MSIYQFECGVAVGINSIGNIVPTFTISDENELVVVAGPEALESPEPSIFIRKTITATVVWRLTEPGAGAEQQSSSRNGRRSAQPPAPSGIVVGMRTLVLARESVSLMSASRFDDALDAFDDGKDTDYLAWVQSQVTRIRGLHEKLRQAHQQADTIGIDPEPNGSDLRVSLERALGVASSHLEKAINNVGLLGVEDVLDGDKNIMEMMGVYQLREQLQHMHVVVDDDMLTELLRLPIVDAYAASQGPSIHSDRYSASSSQSFGDDDNASFGDPLQNIHVGEAPGTPHWDGDDDAQAVGGSAAAPVE